MPNGQELTRRLADLLREPRETLEVELKEWLDIVNDNEHRATLAKALIAMANHGGGHVVFGFRETDDGVVPADPRPPNMAAYTPDTVNSVVNRFAEPPFHCDLHIVTSPESGFQYPIISIPGGHQVPIRSRRSGPDERGIRGDRYYIRRPGPCSEPPQSGQEWDNLVRRCLVNARDDLVNQLRIIMGGGAGEEAAETDRDELVRWRGASFLRWQNLTEALPEDEPRRFPFGYYSIAYQIVGDFEPLEGAALLEALQQGTVRHTGWPPFWVPTRPEITPYLNDGNVECWIGRDDRDRDPSNCDYWQATPDGQFFLLRGYDEDGGGHGGGEPGRFFELTTSTWRIGESLLHAASMARQFGEANALIDFMVEWTGLEGRQLSALANPRRLLMETRTSRQDVYGTSVTVQADQIIDSLPELVDRMVRPLYELFEFFPLPATLVAEELADMLRHRF